MLQNGAGNEAGNDAGAERRCRTALAMMLKDGAGAEMQHWRQKSALIVDAETTMTKVLQNDAGNGASSE